MPFAGSRTLETGAPRTPFDHGLLSVVPFNTGPDHWEAGVQWEPLSCDAISGIGPDCDDEDQVGFPKNFKEGVGLGEAVPFLVYGTYLCSPVGRTLDEAHERAVADLRIHEEARVEQALWTGDLNNTPNLVTDAVVLGGGVVDQEIGFALLEDWIADNYGSTGVIHMTRGVANAMIAKKVVEVKGNSLQTRVGTPVVAGAGYPGTSPAGAAPAAGSGWVFGSPALFGYRGEIFDASSRRGDLLDRGTNDLYAIAERHYLLGFDPCGTAAVNVSLT